MRVVLDTNTLISALLFNGHSSYLVELWQNYKITVLTSEETQNEFLKVLHYSKFKLNSDQIHALRNAYLPYSEQVSMNKQLLPSNFPQCRDIKDQIFLELAYLGQADILISGDMDLLVLNDQVSFFIETPSAFKQRNI